MIGTGEIWGNPFIGLYSVTNDDYCFVPISVPEKFENTIKEVLDVDLVKTSIYDSPLIGLFSSINNKGAILPSIAYSNEIAVFKEYLDVFLVDNFTAVGNLISMNNKTAIISPVITDLPEIEETTGVKANNFKINGVDVTGSMLVMTDKGYVISSLARDNDLREIEKLSGLVGKKATVNYGNPMVKSGILANKNGFIAGETTTSYEIGDIDEGLGGDYDKDI